MSEAADICRAACRAGDGAANAAVVNLTGAALRDKADKDTSVVSVANAGDTRIGHFQVDNGTIQLTNEASIAIVAAFQRQPGNCLTIAVKEAFQTLNGCFSRYLYWACA